MKCKSFRSVSFSVLLAAAFFLFTGLAFQPEIEKVREAKFFVSKSSISRKMLTQSRLFTGPILPSRMFFKKLIFARESTETNGSKALNKEFLENTGQPSVHSRVSKNNSRLIPISAKEPKSSMVSHRNTESFRIPEPRMILLFFLVLVFMISLGWIHRRRDEAGSIQNGSFFPEV